MTRIVILTTILMLPASLPAGGEADTVRLLPLDSFGGTLKGCEVKSFQRFGDGSFTERNELFHGLVGTRVPFGQYDASVTCENDTGAAAIVLVNENEQFIVVSSARHLGDYGPGMAPYFKVFVEGEAPLPTEPTWVALRGVFISQAAVDIVNPDTHAARFGNPEPGTYFLTVFAGGRILCHGMIAITKPLSGLEVRPSKGCSVTGGPGVGVFAPAAPLEMVEPRKTIKPTSQP